MCRPPLEDARGPQPQALGHLTTARSLPTRHTRHTNPNKPLLNPLTTRPHPSQHPHTSAHRTPTTARPSSTPHTPISHTHPPPDPPPHQPPSQLRSAPHTVSPNDDDFANLLSCCRLGSWSLGQQRYYEQQVSQGHDDYYSGRGEAPGEWTGGGAEELGLPGEVSAAQFNALLEGRDPRAPRTRLRAGNSEPTIAAFDLTFSAPKSVSVLFAVAPAEVSAALVEAHEEAVRAALGYLEETAVFVRRGAGGARFEHAGGLIAAAYRHRMSRALDPQLHTHVVAANLARGEDGRYTALHHPSLYRAARTAGYLYQSHLRSLVRERLGLEWGPVHKGAAELAEVPAEVLRVFSQRRAQVEAAVAEREEELGRPSTRAEREAWGAIATRDRKQYGIDTHTWREEITARAAEHGLDHELVEEIVAGGLERRDRGELAGDGTLEQGGARVGESELAEVLTGPTGLTERTNTFDEGAVMREFAAAAPQGSRVDTVRAQVGRFIGRDDVLATRGRTFTSAELVAREAALIDAAVGRRGEGVAQLERGAIDRAIERSDRVLNADQAEAVRAVAGSGDGVDVIEALAGTGKTYTGRACCASSTRTRATRSSGLRRLRGRRASWPSRPGSRRGRSTAACWRSTPAANCLHAAF